MDAGICSDQEDQPTLAPTPALLPPYCVIQGLNPPLSGFSETWDAEKYL